MLINPYLLEQFIDETLESVNINWEVCNRDSRLIQYFSVGFLLTIKNFISVSVEEFLIEAEACLVAAGAELGVTRLNEKKLSEDIAVYAEKINEPLGVEIRRLLADKDFLLEKQEIINKRRMEASAQAFKKSTAGATSGCEPGTGWIHAPGSTC